MATNVLEVLLKATDQMSGVINNAVSNAVSKMDALAKHTKAFSNQAQNISQSSAFAATAVGGAMLHPIKMFAEYDEALAGLKTSMMDVNGVVDTQLLGKMEDYSVKLGNMFKGNSADMMKMFYELTTNGIQAEQVLMGLGEATAQYATLTHQSYETVGKNFGKLVNEMGITNAKLYDTPEKQRQAYLTFTDQLQRAHYMGVKPDDLMYALGRSAGGMKLLKQQGAEAFKGLVPLYSMMIRAGASGEKAGTNVVSMFLNLIDSGRMAKANKQLKEMGENITLTFMDKDGNFPHGEEGIRNLFEQLQKLQGLSTEKLASVMKTIMGGGYDQQIAQNFVASGLKGYEEMMEAMQRQADAAKKTEEIQKTLGMTWENTLSILNNVEIDWVRSFSDDLKSLLRTGVQPFLLGLQKWVAENRNLAKSIGLGAIGFVGFSASMALVSGVLYVFSKAIANTISMVSGLVKGIAWVSRTLGFLKGAEAGVKGVAAAIGLLPRVLALASLAFNPLVAAAILAVGLVYKYWEPIKGFFGGLWDGLTGAVSGNLEGWPALFQTALGKITGHLGEFFSWVALKFTGLFQQAGDTGFWTQLGADLGNWIGSKLMALDAAVAQSRESGFLSGQYWSNAANIIREGWVGIPQVLADAWSALSGVASPVTDAFMGMLERGKLAVQGLFNIPNTLMDGIPSFGSLEGLWANLMGNLAGAKDALLTSVTGLWDDISMAFSLGQEALLSGLSGAWSSLQNAISGLGNVLSDAWSGLTGTLVAAFSTVWQSVLGIAARVNPMSLFEQLAMAAQGAYANMLGLFGDMATAAQGVYNDVVGVLGSMVTSAQQVLSPLGSRIMDGFASVSSGIQSFIQSIDLGGMASRVMTSLRAGFDTSMAFLRGIAAQFAGIPSQIGGVIAQLGGVIGTYLNSAAQYLTGFIQQSRTTLSTWGTAIRSGIQQAFSMLGTVVSTQLNHAAVAVQGFLNRTQNWFATGFARIAQVAGQAAQQITTRLQTAFRTALAAAQAFVQGVVARLLSLYNQAMSIASRFLAVGKRIIDMIVNGIQSGIAKLIGAMSKVGQVIMDHMPRSPAKTGPLRDINKINIVGTIAETMKPHPVAKAAERVAATVQRGVHNKVTLPRSHNSHKSSVVNFSPTINVQGTGQDVRSEVEAAITMAFKEFNRKERLHYAL